MKTVKTNEVSGRHDFFSELHFSEIISPPSAIRVGAEKITRCWKAKIILTNTSPFFMTQTLVSVSRLCNPRGIPDPELY